MKKSNLILLVVLVIIGVVFYLDTERQERQQEQEAQEKRLVDLPTEEIASVAIERPNSPTIRAVTDSEQWRLVSPVQAPGDQTAWDNIISNVAEGERERLVVENPESLEDFGLDSPQLTVTFGADTSGATPSRLVFGDETPISGRYYAMIGGSSDVLTVRSFLYTTLDKELYDLRDKSVLPFETGDAQKLEFQSPRLSFAAERTEGDEWALSEPIQGRADGQKIRSLLTSLSNAEVQQFIVDEPDMPEIYGLIDPATRVTVWTGDSADSSQWAARGLVFGATDGPSGNYFVQREGQENIFTVQKSILNNVPASLSDLRKRALASIRSWNVSAFTIHAADELILHASKDSGDWFIQAPEAGEADYRNMSELVRSITSLEADDFLAEAPSGVDWENPAVSIQLKDAPDPESDETLVTDQIDLATHTISSGTGTVEVYVGKRENPPEYFTLEQATVDDILQTARNFEPIPEEVAAEADVAASTE